LAKPLVKKEGGRVEWWSGGRWKDEKKLQVTKYKLQTNHKLQ
jgi:hypothetical protein